LTLIELIYDSTFQSRSLRYAVMTIAYLWH